MYFCTLPPPHMYMYIYLCSYTAHIHVYTKPSMCLKTERNTVIIVYLLIRLNLLCLSYTCSYW